MGGIAQAIINLNMIITLFGSYFLFKSKINSNIIISIFGAILTISYAAIESSKINKK